MTKKEKQRDKMNLDALHEINDERIRYRDENKNLIESNRRLQKDLDEMKTSLAGIQMSVRPIPDIKAFNVRTMNGEIFTIPISRETITKLASGNPLIVHSQPDIQISAFPGLKGILEDHELIESLARFWRQNGSGHVREVLGRIINA